MSLLSGLYSRPDNILRKVSLLSYGYRNATWMMLMKQFCYANKINKASSLKWLWLLKNHRDMKQVFTFTTSGNNLCRATSHDIELVDLIKDISTYLSIPASSSITFIKFLYQTSSHWMLTLSWISLKKVKYLPLIFFLTTTE